MKATEIVEKFKEVLLGAEKEVEVQAEEVVQEEVQEPTEETQLSEEQVEETSDVKLEEEATEEASEEVEEELNETLYATREELAEVKAMVEKLMGMMDSKQTEAMEVPKEELSAVEEPAEPIVHTPENETEKQFTNFAPNAPKNTMSRVLEMINR